MNKVLVAILGIGLVLLFSSVSSADIVSDLTGYWHLDGNGNDSSGLGHNFSTIGGTISYDSNDKIAGSHSAIMGTSSAYGEMQAVDDGNLTNLWQMTFSTWVKFDSVPTHYSKILNKWGGGTNGRLYQLYWDYNTNKFTFGLANSGNVGIYMNSNTVSLQAGTWYHLVVTAKTDLPAGQPNVWMYFTPVGQSSVTKIMETEWAPSDGNRAMNYSNRKPLIIGSQYDNWQLEGKMDEVRFYRRHLTESEVQELYNAENIPEPAAMLFIASGVSGVLLRRRAK